MMLPQLVMSRIQKVVKRNVRKIQHANFGPTVMNLPNGDLEEKNVGFKTQMRLKPVPHVPPVPEGLEIVQKVKYLLYYFGKKYQAKNL